MEKKVRIGIAALLCVACAVTAAFGTLAFVIFRLGGVDIFRESCKYAAVRRVIDASYVGDIDAQGISDEACRTAVSALGDRWSYYMSAEEYENYMLYSANQYVGIGVTISAVGGEYKIEAVAEDSPARAAGIVTGDVIVRVDGNVITALSTAEIRALITENGGAELTVRSPEGTERNVYVECAAVYKEPVTSEMLHSDIGYIRIANFEDGSGDGAVSAAEELLSNGARAIIFDVRDNPGGKVNELLKILDALLPEGELFISVDRDGNETVDTSDPACIEVPMAVLINGRSYSAAEFFAAVMSEYGAAVTVGEPTTGKSRSQVTAVLADGSAVHLSKYKYLTPGRKDLFEQGGLVPDIEAEPRSESGEDAQLAVALAALT